MLLGDIPIPLDVLVVTPREWRIQRNVPGTVVWPAWREGIVLYERRR
jgi:hypothetical protein